MAGASKNIAMCANLQTEAVKKKKTDYVLVVDTRKDVKTKENYYKIYVDVVQRNDALI